MSKRYKKVHIDLFPVKIRGKLLEVAEKDALLFHHNALSIPSGIVKLKSKREITGAMVKHVSENNLHGALLKLGITLNLILDEEEKGRARFLAPERGNAILTGTLFHLADMAYEGTFYNYKKKEK